MALLGDYYAPRIRVPQMIQRGKTQVVELAVYRNGAIVTPTSATYQLLDEDGRADDVDKRRAAFPMISTTNPPSRYHRFKYRKY